MNYGLQKYHLKKRLIKMGYESHTASDMMDHTDPKVEFDENWGDLVRVIESGDYKRETEGVNIDYWDDDKTKKTSEGYKCSDYLEAIENFKVGKDCSDPTNKGCPDEDALQEACYCGDKQSCWDLNIVKEALEEAERIADEVMREQVESGEITVEDVLESKVEAAELELEKAEALIEIYKQGTLSDYIKASVMEDEKPEPKKPVKKPKPKPKPKREYYDDGEEYMIMGKMLTKGERVDLKANGWVDIIRDGKNYEVTDE